MLMSFAEPSDHIWCDLEEQARRVCRRFFRGRPDALEDALSTVMTRALLKWDLVAQAGERMPAYVARMAENVCRSQMRDDRRTPATMPLDEAAYVSQAESVHEIVERRLLLEWAIGLVNRLPEHLREPFISYRIHGDSYEEIAQNLGITGNAARQRVARAQRMLAAMLERSERSDRSDRPDTSDRSQPGDGARRGARRSKLLGPLLDEIAARMADTRVIHVPLRSGGVLEYHAVFEYRVGRCAQRIETLAKYAVRFPRGWRKRVELADLLLAESRVGEAEEQYRETLRRQPRALRATLRLGQLLCLQGRCEEAAQVYLGALTHVASSATRHHLRGLAERALSGGPVAQYATERKPEHYERAAAEFMAAMAEEPRNLAHRHELAATYDAWGKPVEAAAAYDAALAVDPDDTFALARSHNALLVMGRSDLIEARLKRAVEVDPNYLYAAKLLADLRASRGLVRGREGQRTVAMLKRVLAREPETADAWDALNRYHDFRFEFSTGVAIWEAFLARNPGNARAWTFLGTALDRAGEPNRAAEAYARSHELDPSWLDVYWRGLPTLLKVGRTDEARAWVEELLSRFADHWDACLRAAGALRQLGVAPEVYLPVARRAVELQPKLCAAWIDFGHQLLPAGRASDALEAFETARRLAEGVAMERGLDAALCASRALTVLGRDTEARRTLLDCERMARGLNTARRFVVIGRVRGDLSDLEGAAKAYRQALKHGCWYARVELEEVVRRLAERAEGTPATDGPER